MKAALILMGVLAVLMVDPVMAGLAAVETGEIQFEETP